MGTTLVDWYPQNFIPSFRHLFFLFFPKVCQSPQGENCFSVSTTEPSDVQSCFCATLGFQAPVWRTVQSPPLAILAMSQAQLVQTRTCLLPQMLLSPFSHHSSKRQPVTVTVTGVKASVAFHCALFSPVSTQPRDSELKWVSCEHLSLGSAGAPPGGCPGEDGLKE